MYETLTVSPEPRQYDVIPKAVESYLPYRLFEKYAREGNPAVGQSWILCVKDQLGFRLPRAVAAVTLTDTSRQSGILKGKRMIIWPACDITKPAVWNSGIVINLNHISFESDGERIDSHMTSSGRTGTKLRESNGGMRRVGNDFVLGRLFVKDFDHLDRLVEARVKLNPRFSKIKIKRDLPQLEASISKHPHPVLPVPFGRIWGKDAFVCFELRLSDNSVNEKWPVFIPREHVVGGNIKDGDDLLCKYAAFQISPGLFLKMGVILIPADLDVPLMWQNEDSDARRALAEERQDGEIA